jgi:hypothetical protein
MALHFNDVTTLEECDEYLSGLSAFSDLTSVAGFTKAFRDSFGTKYAKGFLFDIATIDDLRAQNGGNLSGIRIYMGLKNSFGIATPIAVAVAVVNGDDFAIPVSSSGSTTAVLAEGRPCPSECGQDNALTKT